MTSGVVAELGLLVIQVAKPAMTSMDRDAVSCFGVDRDDRCGRPSAKPARPT